MSDDRQCTMPRTCDGEDLVTEEIMMRCIRGLLWAKPNQRNATYLHYLLADRLWPLLLQLTRNVAVRETMSVWAIIRGMGDRRDCGHHHGPSSEAIIRGMGDRRDCEETWRALSQLIHHTPSLNLG